MSPLDWNFISNTVKNKNKYTDVLHRKDAYMHGKVQNHWSGTNF